MKTSTTLGVILLAVGLVTSPFGSPALAQEPQIEIQTLAENLHYITGAGGNIAVLVGESSLLLVDAGTAEAAEATATALQEKSALPVSVLVNTHYHADHSGGNGVLGPEAEIVCHRDAQQTYLANQESGKDSPAAGAPTKTYQKELELTLEGSSERVTLRHFGDAHTSGDTVVVFENAKVMHVGDMFFHGLAPYIDVGDGCDTANWIETIRTLARDYPDHTVIPGHGPVTDMAAWGRFADYLETIRTQVLAAIDEGQSEDETVANIDLSAYSELQEYTDWGLTRENNVRWVFQELTQAAK